MRVGLPGNRLLGAQKVADARASAVAVAQSAQTAAVLKRNAANDAVSAATVAVVARQTALGIAVTDPKTIAALRADPALQAAKVEANAATAALSTSSDDLRSANAAMTAANDTVATERIDFAKGPTLAAILAEANNLQDKYADNYAKAGKWSDIAQLPIIGAAAYAAGVVIDKPKNATSILGYAGIAAGAYSTTRAQIFPVNLPDLYLGGYAAMACVTSSGAMFLSGDAVAAQAEFQQRLTAVDQAIVVLDSTLGNVTPGMEKELAVALKLAELARTQADAADAAAAKQLAAYRSKEAAFQSMIALISESVAKKARIRQSIDFATLRDAFYKAPAAAGTDSGPGSGSITETRTLVATDIQPVLIANTGKLILATKRLLQSMPDYVAVLAVIQGCPDKLN